MVRPLQLSASAIHIGFLERTPKVCVGLFRQRRLQQLWLVTFVLVITTIACATRFFYFHGEIVYAKSIHNVTTNDNSSASINLDELRSKRLVIWTNDIHPAPISDVRQFVEPLGVHILEYNLGGLNQCPLFNVCDGRKQLKVLTMENVPHSDHGDLMAKFYQAYKDDPVMKMVDAFYCSDVIANCQLYFPFNKSMIIVATTRYYNWRVTTDRYNRWTAHFKQIAADPRNVIAANSLYDAKFIRYFTGIEPTYIPTYAGYTKAHYNPSKPTYVIKIRYEKSLIADFTTRFNARNCSSNVQDMPSKYQYSELAKYQGIIHIPYQVSTMSYFEQYRMNIPLFFPSRPLLVKWAVDHWILRERTHPIFERYPDSPPADKSQKHLPSPNDNVNPAAIDYWVQFADFYTMPYIQYFDSFEHLSDMLCRTTQEELQKISKKMSIYNADQKARLTIQWEEIVRHLEKYKPAQKASPA